MKIFLKKENRWLQGLSRSAQIWSKAQSKLMSVIVSPFTQGKYPNILCLLHDYLECPFYAYITHMLLACLNHCEFLISHIKAPTLTISNNVDWVIWEKTSQTCFWEWYIKSAIWLNGNFLAIYSHKLSHYFEAHYTT